MRSNQGSTVRGVAGKLSMAPMSVEWLAAGSWRLPSGKALAEFALQAGFLAPLLFRAEQSGIDPYCFHNPGPHRNAGMPAAGRQFEKGSGT